MSVRGEGGVSGALSIVKSYPGGYRRAEQKSIRAGPVGSIPIAADREPRRTDFADTVHRNQKQSRNPVNAASPFVFFLYLPERRMDSGGYKPLGGVDDQQDQKNIGGKRAIYEKRAKNSHHMCASAI